MGSSVSSRYKPVGWRGESHRHYLAAKGITTKRYFVRDELKGNRTSRELHRAYAFGHDDDELMSDESLRQKFGVSLEEIMAKRRRRSVYPEGLSRSEEMPTMIAPIEAPPSPPVMQVQAPLAQPVGLVEQPDSEVDVELIGGGEPLTPGVPGIPPEEP